MQGSHLQQVTRKCRVCSLLKPYSEMVKNKGFSCGVDTICLECSRERVKLWRKENPEKRAKQMKKEAGKPYTINKHLRSKYGITHIEYNEMFIAQKGCCTICGLHQSNFTRRLSVDHCHTTGKIRALLCSHCNSMIGYAKDDTNILNSAIEYLKEYNGTN